MKRTLILMLLLAVSLSCSIALAADDSVRPLTRASFLFVNNNWTEEFTGGDEVKLGQSAFATQIQRLVTPQIQVELWGTLSSTKATMSDDQESSFSALNDTRLRGSYLFGDGLGRATLMLNVPTGKKSLTDEEFQLAVGVADATRKYLVRRFGEGFDIGAEVVLTPRLENMNLEVGGGYLIKGPYKVLKESDADYKYGNELYGTARLGFVREISSYQVFLLVKTYGEDEYDSEPAFQAGNTIRIGGSYGYRKQVQLTIGGDYLLRGKAKVRSSESDQLNEEASASGRNELRVYGRVALPIKERVRALARAEYKMIAENDYDKEEAYYRPDAHYIGVGGGLDAVFSPRVGGSLMIMLYSGKVADDDLRGVGISAAVVVSI